MAAACKLVRAGGSILVVVLKRQHWNPGVNSSARPPRRRECVYYDCFVLSDYLGTVALGIDAGECVYACCWTNNTTSWHSDTANNSGDHVQ